MSHSGKRTAWEERGDQQRAHNREQEVTVVCKNLVFLHKTEKGGVLVQENEELAGSNWRADGKKTWVPAQACLFSPPLNMLRPGSAVTVEMPKRMADEKEMFYE